MLFNVSYSIEFMKMNKRAVIFCLIVVICSVILVKSDDDEFDDDDDDEYGVNDDEILYGHDEGLSKNDGSTQGDSETEEILTGVGVEESFDDEEQESLKCLGRTS